MGLYGYFVYKSKKEVRAHNPAEKGERVMNVTSPNRQQRRAIEAGKGPKAASESFCQISPPKSK